MDAIELLMSEIEALHICLSLQKNNALSAKLKSTMDDYKQALGALKTMASMNRKEAIKAFDCLCELFGEYDEYPLFVENLPPIRSLLDALPEEE